MDKMPKHALHINKELLVAMPLLLVAMPGATSERCPFLAFLRVGTINLGAPRMEGGLLANPGCDESA